MKVSVVIPLYNKASFIEACLDSLVAQTMKDFEVVVVDDASTDDGMSKVEVFEGLRIRTRRLERNMGPSGAVQRAIDMAVGEYIVRVDADDIMMPDRLERQVALMEADPGLGASGGSAVLFGTEEGVLSYPVADADCRAEILFGVPIPQPGSIIRTSMLRRSGVRFEDEWPRVGEDWLFWAALSKHTRFANTEAPVIQYRRGPQNSTYGMDRVAKFRPMVERLLVLCGLPNDERSVRSHLMLLGAFDTVPNADAVTAIRAWSDRLRKWNEEVRHCDPAIFDRRVERQWDWLFFRLAAFGPGPALVHWRISGDRSFAKLSYLMKYTVRKWLGRTP
jgi:glycosyltransferase involved in cell wall biosynthesis